MESSRKGPAGNPSSTSTLSVLGLVAVTFGFLWVASWELFPGAGSIHANDPEQLAHFGPHEAPFLIAATVVEAVLVAFLTSLLARRWRASWDEGWRKLLATPRTSYAALAVLAAGVAFVVGYGVLGDHAISEDDKTYLYQAHLLLQGKLSEPVPVEAAAFWQPFIVNVAGRWSAQYFWAQPAFLAPGVLANVPLAIPPLELAVTVFFTGKLAEEFTEDARAGLVAAILAASSPILLFTAGTVHSANLSAACTSASLFAIARLSRRPDRKASVLLGLAVGVAAHNRALDELSVLFGAGILLLIHFRGIRGVARSLGPAVLVSLPLLALLPILNKAAWGSYTTTGYALFNGKWKTMGFGRGPFGADHTLPIAAAKTIAVLVRLAFYETGCPLGFALLAVPVLGLLSRRALAPIVPVVAYLVAYFFYAASSIDPTGPVYYLGLTPVLLAWVAVTAVEIHDRTRETGFRRAVPAFLVAQSLAGIGVFWPPQLQYLARDIAMAKQCEDLVHDAGVSRGLVFALLGPPWPGLMTWQRAPPLTTPPFDGPLLFARARGLVNDRLAVRRFAGDRPVYLARCLSPEAPTLLRYDPTAEQVTNLDGSEPRLFEPGRPNTPPRVGDYAPIFRAW